jgi:hypothetical protein
VRPSANARGRVGPVGPRGSIGVWPPRCEESYWRSLGRDAPIGIVLDPANLLSPETVSRQSEIRRGGRPPRRERRQRAPKDVVASGYAAAGAGRMDDPSAFRQLARLPPVPLIVQDAHEIDAPPWSSWASTASRCWPDALQSQRLPPAAA